MAFITDATRKVVIDHAVATLGRAPSAAELAAITKLLNNNASLADVADYLTSSEGYLAKYPLGQTAKEVGADILDASIVGGVLAADIRLAAIDIIAGGLTAGTYTIASATNAVVAFLSNTANNANTDFGDIAKAFQNRTAAAEEFTTTFTLEGVTVTEADLAAAVEGVTSDAATLTAAKAAFAAGSKSIAEQAAADKAVADAAAAKAAEEKAAADKVAADKAAADKAAADAVAAEEVLTDAYTAAAAEAATAITASEAADAALIAAQTASEAAATKAALTDATALTAVTTAATTADTDAKAAVVTAQTAYDAALVAGVAVDVSTANGELLIAQNNASVAAAALVTATAASDAATADDAAAATAATALEAATTASDTAAAAADAAAAAAVTAAAATADTDDDTAAAVLVTEAAASNPTGDAAVAAAAKAAADKAAADKAAADKAAADAAAAQKVIDDAAAAQKVIDDAAAAKEALKQTFALTTNTDVVTGGEGDDTFVGSGTTFNSDDVLNGGAGEDTLSVTVAPTGAASVIANLTDIETVKITNGGAAAQTVNMISATGVTSIENRLSSDDVTLTNVQALATVTANGSTAGETTVSFANSLVSGTADTVNLALTNDATAQFNVGGTTASNEFDVINVSSTSGTLNTLTTIEASDSTALVKKVAINITGDTALTVGAIATGAASTINAADFTGVLKITASANNASITGGSAADTITLTGRTLAGTSAAAETFSGGEGSDTIVFDAGIATSQLVALNSGVHTYAAETFNFVEATAADVTIEAEAITGATTIEIDAIAGDDDSALAADLDVITITKIVDETIVIDHTTSAGVANTDGTHVSVALKTATGTADEVNVTLKNTTAASNLGVLTSSGATETVNITASNAKAYTVSSVQAASATTLNITGSGDVVLGDLAAVNLAAATATRATLIDASTATGKVSIGDADTAGFEATSVTVKGGSAADKFYFGGTLSAADSIDGGDGSDTLYASDSATAASFKPLSVVNVETFEIDTITSGAKTFDMTNVSATTGISIVDTANAKGFGTTVSKIAGQTVTIKTQDNAGTATNFTGETIALSTATGTTSLNVVLDDQLTSSLPNGVAFAGTINTNGASAVTITDSTQDINGTAVRFINNAVALSGTATTGVVTSLTLAGGGMSSATANSTMTVTATSNVLLTTLDATGLSSDLNMASVTMATGGAVNLGSGDNTVTIALADAVRDEINVDGGDGTDTLAMLLMNNATYRPGTNNVETFAAQINSTQTGAVVLDGSDTSGVTKVALTVSPAAATDENVTIQNFATLATVTTAGTYGSGAGDTVAIDDTGATTIITSDTTALTNGGLTLADATSLTVKLASSSAGASTAEFTAAVLAPAKATSITLGGSDTTAAGVAYVGKIDVPTLTAASATTLTLNTDQGDIDLDTVTAAKVATVTVTGDNALVFGTTGATTTALASFSAAAATGAITIGQAVDFTSSATVTTGSGSDSITIDVLTEGGVGIDTGEKTAASPDSDTLLIAGANNMGVTVIDLSAADQINQLNGAINAAVQTGVENITLSGLTGSFGATVTGSADANTIIGTANADNIIAGEGIDVITGGAGNDTIDLSEAVSKLDTVVFAATAALTGADTITGFTAADSLDFSSFATDNTFAVSGEVADGSTGDIATSTTDGTGIVDNSVLLVLDADGNFADTAAAVAGLFDDATDAGQAFETVAASADVVVIVRDTTNNETQIWYVDNDATAVVATGEVTLVGTLTGFSSAFVDLNITD
ncbi:hypothetical protein N9513_06370 [Gammaproteobacteria bacterium]|nr:hypothetical protein [Gammaproteobacteria bacterium]